MKNILIVGGAGYVGSHTVKLLAEKNINCLVIDNLSTGHLESLPPSASFLNVDLLNKEQLVEVFETNSISSVIHFAAFAYVGESVKNPKKYYENNVVGTINLLNTMLDFNVKNFVFSSTCATYGEPLYTPIDETHPQNPINPYGRTKLIIENILSDYNKAYGLNYISLRYFNAAGADINALIGESHSPETHLIPLVLQTIKGERANLEIFGNDYKTADGTCIRDYTHVDDLAQAHYLALEKVESYSGCLNLGTGKGTSVLEVIKAAEKVTSQKCHIKIMQRRDGDPHILFASNHKAKEILKWEPKYINIEDIIKSAWAWELNRRF